MSDLKWSRMLRNVITPRRGGVRVYGVGAAKTGTHSLAQMFEDRVTTGHENTVRPLVRLHLERLQSGNDRRLRLFLRARDAALKLKLDSSSVNVYLVEDLLALYPDSRFVLTIRPPVAWLRSMLDHTLRHDSGEPWKRFRELRFSRPEPFPAQEEALRKQGLYSVAGYLQHWRDAITRVTDRVPPDQLLVVRTEDLAARSAEIAAFCGIPGGAVPAEKSHAYANPRRFHVLNEIPADHLLEVARAECASLMERHFPERNLESDIRDIQAKAA